MSSQPGLTLKVEDLTLVDNATTIAPSANRTICRFASDLSESISIDVDFSNCELGDELIIIFAINSEGVYLNFNDKFSINGGNGDQQFTPRQNEWALSFIFDGDRFISTYEHC